MPQDCIGKKALAMKDDWATLLARLRACTQCEGLPLGPKPVFQLDPAARILVAGQAPGRIAHEKGRPFDDPSGDRLRDWMGIDRQAFYGDARIGIFPMGLCFPGKGKGGDNPPRPLCAATWRAAVLAQLTDVRLVLVIGRYAIDWHAPDLRKASVQDAVRQGAAQGAALDTMILPHPSPRNTAWLARNAWFEAEHVPRLRARIADLLAT